MSTSFSMCVSIAFQLSHEAASSFRVEPSICVCVTGARRRSSYGCHHFIWRCVLAIPRHSINFELPLFRSRWRRSIVNLWKSLSAARPCPRYITFLSLSLALCCLASSPCLGETAKSFDKFRWNLSLQLGVLLKLSLNNSENGVKITRGKVAARAQDIKGRRQMSKLSLSLSLFNLISIMLAQN